MEEEYFKCGHCGEPVKTFWASNNMGVLRGDYVLAGDVIFHIPCWDKFTEPLWKEELNEIS